MTNIRQSNKKKLMGFLVFSLFIFIRIFLLVPFPKFSSNSHEQVLKGWKKGRGWGWVWGDQDEVGALNAITSQSILDAIKLVKSGQVYDLGIVYDRTSYKWPGHSPAEIISFRTPEGVKRQKDHDFAINKAGLAWHSCALFINDNVATQIDSLGHITTGSDNHWYNGFSEADWGGN